MYLLITHKPGNTKYVTGYEVIPASITPGTNQVCIALDDKIPSGFFESFDQYTVAASGSALTRAGSGDLNYRHLPESKEAIATEQGISTSRAEGILGLKWAAERTSKIGIFANL